MNRGKSLDRRMLLTAGAAAAAVAGCSQPAAEDAAGPAAPAVSRNRQQLRMVTTWPQNFPGLGAMAERTAEIIGALTGGDLTVRVYAAGEIVPAFESFDAVSSGAADMYHGAEYYWQGKSKGFNFFTSVPMGLTTAEMTGWLEFGGGQALWDGLAAQFNIKPFVAGTTGHQMGGWFKREINSLEDWRGLTMRIPGLGGEVVRGLGGSAVALPGAEIYSSLQSGAIDATEWVGPWNDLAFGFHQAAPYYYGPGFHEPGSMLSLGVNRSVWEGLTDDHKRVVEVACAHANNTSIAEYQHQNAVALRTLTEDHGVQLRTFPDEVWERVREISEDVLASLADEDAETAQIYESFAQARARSASWAVISEAPYLRQRALLANG